MKWIIPFEKLSRRHGSKVGGKAKALGELTRSGCPVPVGACVTTEAYDTFTSHGGLAEKILMELNRKDFADMRWEEIWDASLRIRNLFLHEPLPKTLDAALHDEFDAIFADHPVAVRSSALAEDAAGTSFAGLHESYLNVAGAEEIIKHVRLVWASLWSDAALLYRREIGLDVESSSMAVVVQELAVGDCSGVAFTRDPNDENRAVVESVHGLNQGLVDGEIEPDRWVFNRSDGTLTGTFHPSRTEWMVPGPSGVVKKPLPETLRNAPPLSDELARDAWRMAIRAEDCFKCPQDVEWTLVSGRFQLLQSRPITTLRGNGDDEPNDQRGWYLSLRRSFENLKALRVEIEEGLIPEMIAEADAMNAVVLDALSDDELAEETRKRRGRLDKWNAVYWDRFIPFAHGFRLFGQVYNDAVEPDDPYEFVELLKADDMVGLDRNRRLATMADLIRRHPETREELENGATPSNAEFIELRHKFIDRYGDLSNANAPSPSEDSRQIGFLDRVLLKMADDEGGTRKPASPMKSKTTLTKAFLDRFDGEKRSQAEEMLELGRVSYKLRDDDNIHLGRIETAFNAAVTEMKRRLRGRNDSTTGIDVLRTALAEALPAKPDKAESTSAPDKEDDFIERPRQLTGQPAGPGLATGACRVVSTREDIVAFESGEVLVCDAIDPTMTFVVPLASAVVERRGGMLIHGAIIAREYGIPCVTGVPDAATRLHTGDRLTVDGYLGIVTVTSVIEARGS